MLHTIVYKDTFINLKDSNSGISFSMIVLRSPLHALTTTNLHSSSMCTDLQCATSSVSQVVNLGKNMTQASYLAAMERLLQLVHWTFGAWKPNHTPAALAMPRLGGGGGGGDLR